MGAIMAPSYSCFQKKTVKSPIINLETKYSYQLSWPQTYVYKSNNSLVTYDNWGRVIKTSFSNENPVNLAQ